MDESIWKSKHSNDITNKSSEQQEKLRKKREINARYSRLLVSKTIQHFQSQGHVTISISEKSNCKSGNFCCCYQARVVF